MIYRQCYMSLSLANPLAVLFSTLTGELHADPIAM